MKPHGIWTISVQLRFAVTAVRTSVATRFFLCSCGVGPAKSLCHLRQDTMLHLLRPLSALVLVTSCLKWPSMTYATPDRCRLPAPNDIYGCPYPRRVYYNTPQGQCVPYAYCGAAGSMYGFETWEECERVCGMQGDKMATYTGKFSFVQSVIKPPDILCQGAWTAGHETTVRTKLLHSLVPRLRPAFRCFQHGKAGEGLVSFLT